MTEYALLSQSGEVANIVSSVKTLAELAAQFGDRWRVVPVEQVPDSVMRRYEFWDTRP